MYHVWPVSSFFTKRYHKVLSGSLWSALTAHGRNEVCRRKALFLPSLKRLIERPHSNVVSYRQVSDHLCVIIALWLDTGAFERNDGIVLDIQEVGGLQVVVAIFHARIQGRCVDLP